MKTKTLILCVSVAVFSLGFLNLPTQPLAPLLWINPVDSTVEENQTTDLVVQLGGVSNVYGLSMELSFDPSVLEVIDADQAITGVQITPGSCPIPEFIPTNEADNTAGAIQYVVVHLFSPPCDGGQVASIRIKCIAPDPNSIISFTSSIISDPEGSEISHSSQIGQILCTEVYEVYLPAVMK